MTAGSSSLLICTADGRVIVWQSASGEQSGCIRIVNDPTGHEHPSQRLRR
jgi:hypothetical protein